MPGSQRPRPARARSGASVQAKRVRHGPRRPARARARGKVGEWRSNRFAIASLILVMVLGIAGVKLVYLQAFQAQALSEQSERQRATVIHDQAERGTILDRQGKQLAFSVETRTLQVNLKAMRATWAKIAAKNPERTFDKRAKEISAYIAKKVPHLADEKELVKKFRAKANFTFLVNGVEPSVADDITERFKDIAQETRAEREYPAGQYASNVVGLANWRMDDPDTSKHNLHGLMGIEGARDNDLVGKPGQRLVDTGAGDNVPIPGSERQRTPEVPGADLELTLDSDVQFELQRSLAEYVKKSKAKGGSAVVMDARSGEVYGLVNDKQYDPRKLNDATDRQKNNLAVTTPYEPGSVAKVITAAGVIEHRISKPNAWHRVPGQIQIADRTVRDAWGHGTVGMTTTGIFAKSSNVGTLQLAKRLGEQRWLDLAKKFGIGQRTNVGLPGESGGHLPPREQWSGSTFGNLPIGQGLSMTVVQMASMVQAIANDGVRVEPRIARGTHDADGHEKAEPKGKKTRVVTKKTATKVKNMLRAVTQEGENQNSGTAPKAGLDGYQISGKTGTGQQIDKTGKYSQTDYNITFAGMLPADDPRFVVGIMLDAPDYASEQGSSAGPLFHEVAAYLAQRYQIPLSKKQTPVVPLIRGN